MPELAYMLNSINMAELMFIAEINKYLAGNNMYSKHKC
jgi:hypothetical protein